MADPEPGEGCEARWIWWDSDAVDCPGCGCRVRVAVHDDAACTVLVCEEADDVRAGCPCADCAVES